MTKIVKVTPAPGRLVRDPATMQPIGPGDHVDLDEPFWWARLNQGDILLYPDPPTPAANAPTVPPPATPAAPTPQQAQAKS